MALPHWFEALLPAPTSLQPRQQAITAAGAFIGIGAAALICGLLDDGFDPAWWLMAPLGATAAQIFSVPASPMSQPWPVVAGHALSALAGLIAFHLFGYSSLGAAVAVGLAVALMMPARALHPSGGGTALLVVLAKVDAWQFILFPVVVNAAVLVVLAMAWHRLTGHAYPHRQRLEKTRTLALHRFDPADLEGALREQGEILDVSREDIKRVIEATEMNAYRRMAGGLTCEQIMTRPVKHVDLRARAATARNVMVRNGLKILPVIGDQQRLAGAVKSLPSSPAGDVAGYLNQDFITAVGSDLIAEVLPLLNGDKTHVLVIDADNRLKGIISKSDIMRALFRNEK